MSIQQILKNIPPKKLFLIDGFGALLSAFLLGVVLTRFEPIFGMPKKALYFLAFLPCLFALYDFICYYRIKENWRPFLRGIAIANLAYCCISIGFLIQHEEVITNVGLGYFVLEIIIVAVLARIELKA